MFKPMLAGTYTGSEAYPLALPKLGSPKYDGVRALIIGGVVLSRNFKPIPSARVQTLFGRRELNGFDGELIVGPPTSSTCYRDTMSGVMSVDANPRDVRLYVFDDFTRSVPYAEQQIPYSDRLQELAARLKNLKHEHVSYVQHERVTSLGLMTALEERYLGEGYEGLMLRDPRSPYKHGRSTEREGYLLKVKRFEDGEAVVTGVEELMHNTNEVTKDALGRTARSSHQANLVGRGMLGAFLVRDLKTDVAFKIGTGQGLTEDDRKRLWGNDRGASLIATVRKYRFFPSGSKERPRFPVDLGARDPIDL